MSSICIADICYITIRFCIALVQLLIDVSPSPIVIRHKFMLSFFSILISSLGHQLINLLFTLLHCRYICTHTAQCAYMQLGTELYAYPALICQFRGLTPQFLLANSCITLDLIHSGGHLQSRWSDFKTVHLYKYSSRELDADRYTCKL